MDHRSHAGVAFIGMANTIGASTAITAGAVISGAYFGDKMTPLSETTILTPKIVGSNVYIHIASMAKATVPAYLIALVLLLLGLRKYPAFLSNLTATLVGTLLISPHKFLPVASLNNRVHEQRI